MTNAKSRRLCYIVSPRLQAKLCYLGEKMTKGITSKTLHFIHGNPFKFNVFDVATNRSAYPRQSRYHSPVWG